jgi:NAD(P)-dependent dehydrogenase (short-subunit alcohol dehydrogenase family)
VRRFKAQGGGQTYEQFTAGMAKGRIPIGRMGKAEEFARMACFLCSDAGSFITGVAINVDGGASPVT